MKRFLPVLFFLANGLLITAVRGQTAPAHNKPSQTITYRAIPAGPSVFGVFEGRPPCPVLARQLHLSTDADCVKLKMDIAFYRNPATLKPDSFVLSIVGSGDVVRQEGGSYRYQEIRGRWSIVKGRQPYPAMEIYRLTLNNRGTTLNLLRGDENVLFILDQHNAVMAGNPDFSFTLNRVELVPGKQLP
jgi:hypothetical protein